MVLCLPTYIGYMHIHIYRHQISAEMLFRFIEFSVNFGSVPMVSQCHTKVLFLFAATTELKFNTLC
jgi:hypothetical protein